MKIKLRTKERTIKMRGESASLSPKQRHRKAMVLRAVREKAAQAAQSKQPEQPSVEASAVDQVQQMGEFTARKAAYIAHEKRKLQKQARRSKATKTEHTDIGTSNDVTQSTVENCRPIHTAEAAEGKPSAVSRNEAAIPKVAHTETGAVSRSEPRTQVIKEFHREATAPKTYKSTAEAIPKAQPAGMKRAAFPRQSTPRQILRQQAVRQQARKSAAIQSAKAAAQTATKAQRVQQLVRAVAQAAVKAFHSIGAALVGGMGGMLLVPLVVVLLVGGLLSSPLGIFFSGEAESTMTLQQVMSELNTAFSDRITEIENANAHDDLRQDGQRPLWKDILTIYAVKTTTDPKNPLDAISMDEEHAEVLRSIFWDMTVIEFTTETYTEEVTVEVPTEDSTDEDSVVEEIQAVERTRLVISISGKTAKQMAEEYGFDEKQLGYVTELLSDEYSDLWASLSVPGGGSDDIVTVALSQVGNVGGQPYWSWYGFSSRVEWCACFVSWCSEQCGYIESGIMPKFSYCPTGVEWFRSRGQWLDRNSIPPAGSIIFFDWGGDGVADHVGIVESCDGSTVYTIEGNANNAVKPLSYAVGNYRIMGYGMVFTNN